MVKGSVRFHLCAPLIFFQRMEIIPFRSRRKIAVPELLTVNGAAFPLIIHRFCYRAYQKAVAKHILISQRRCAFILCKIKKQASHHCIIICPDSCCIGVNIRHQSVSQLNILYKRIIERLAWPAEIPHLPGGVRAV